MPQAPANTKFLLHFNDNCTDEKGFLPASSYSGPYTAGKFGNAVNPGSGSLGVVFPNVSMPGRSKIFSLEFVVNIDALTVPWVIYPYMDNTIIVSLSPQGRTIYNVLCQIGSSGYKYSTTTIEKGTGNHHVVCSRDASDVMRIFIDGAMVFKEVVTDAMVNSVDSITIGKNAGSEIFYIDEFMYVDGNVGVYGSDSGYTVPTAPYSLQGPVINIGGTTITRNASTVVTSDPTAVAAISSIALDPYFSVINNWKIIEFHYAVAGQSGFKKYRLYNDGSNNFALTLIAFSLKAKTGNWVLKKIMIHDFDGEYFSVEGIELPSGLDLVVA